METQGPAVEAQGPAVEERQQDSGLTESVTLMVAVESTASAAVMQDRLSQKWVRGARRLNKKNKLARSLAVKTAFGIVLKACTMGMIHARVQEAVGFNLEKGEPGLFFDRQFYKKVNRPLTTRKPRCCKLDLRRPS